MPNYQNRSAKTNKLHLTSRVTRLLNDSVMDIDSQTDKAKVNEEIQFILENRHNEKSFSGRAVTNIWIILTNFGYGYQTIKNKVNGESEAATEIPDEIWKNLLQATMEYAEELHPRDLPSILNALSKMDAWQNADSYFDNFMQHLLIAIELNFDHLDIFRTLRTLKKLGMQWDSFSDNFKTIALPKILNAELARINSRYLSEFIQTCAVLEMPWNTLNSDNQQKILNVMQQLVLDNCHKMEMHPMRFMAAHSARDEAVTELSLVQQVRLFYDLDFAPDILDELNLTLSKARKETLNPLSLQAGITSTIGTIARFYSPFNYEIEAVLLSFKPVDIYFPDQKVILEIDEKKHYNKHNRLQPKDIFNRNLFKRYGYTVLEVTESEWRTVPDKIEFMITKLQSVNIIPIKLNEIKEEPDSSLPENNLDNNNSWQLVTSRGSPKTNFFKSKALQKLEKSMNLCSLDAAKRNPGSY